MREDVASGRGWRRSRRSSPSSSACAGAWAAIRVRIPMPKRSHRCSEGEPSRSSTPVEIRVGCPPTPPRARSSCRCRVVNASIGMRRQSRCRRCSSASSEISIRSSRLRKAASSSPQATFGSTSLRRSFDSMARRSSALRSRHRLSEVPGTACSSPTRRATWRSSSRSRRCRRCAIVAASIAKGGCWSTAGLRSSRGASRRSGSRRRHAAACSTTTARRSISTPICCR